MKKNIINKILAAEAGGGEYLLVEENEDWLAEYDPDQQVQLICEDCGKQSNVRLYHDGGAHALECERAGRDLSYSQSGKEPDVVLLCPLCATKREDEWEQEIEDENDRRRLRDN